MKHARHALVRGRVQGVGFRWATRERARCLGLVGWVRNLPDGSVEAHVEGEPAALAALEAWIGVGPPGALVETLDVVDAEPGAFERFEVLRG